MAKNVNNNNKINNNLNNNYSNSQFNPYKHNSVNIYSGQSMVQKQQVIDPQQKANVAKGKDKTELDNIYNSLVAKENPEKIIITKRHKKWLYATIAIGLVWTTGIACLFSIQGGIQNNFMGGSVNLDKGTLSTTSAKAQLDNVNKFAIGESKVQFENEYVDNIKNIINNSIPGNNTIQENDIIVDWNDVDWTHDGSYNLQVYSNNQSVKGTGDVSVFVQSREIVNLTLLDTSQLETNPYVTNDPSAYQDLLKEQIFNLVKSISRYPDKILADSIEYSFSNKNPGDNDHNSSLDLSHAKDIDDKNGDDYDNTLVIEGKTNDGYVTGELNIAIHPKAYNLSDSNWFYEPADTANTNKGSPNKGHIIPGGDTNFNTFNVDLDDVSTTPGDYNDDHSCINSNVVYDKIDDWWNITFAWIREDYQYLPVLYNLDGNPDDSMLLEIRNGPDYDDKHDKNLYAWSSDAVEHPNDCWGVEQVFAARDNGIVTGNFMLHIHFKDNNA